MSLRNGNCDRGTGVSFTYRQLAEGWLEDGTFDGLEVEAKSAS